MELIDAMIRRLGTPLLRSDIALRSGCEAVFARWRHNTTKISAVSQKQIQVTLSLSSGQILRLCRNGKWSSRRIESGNIGVIAPGDAERIEVEGAADVFQILLPWSAISENIDHSVTKSLPMTRGKEGALQSALVGAFASLALNHSDCHLFLQSRAYKVIETLFPVRDCSDSNSSSGGLAPGAYRRVTALVRSRMASDRSQNLDLSAMAAAAGLSVHHFLKMFRRTTGKTPHEFVQEQRVNQATYLLSRGQGSICEIASQTGFATASHFIAVFQKHTGVTPGTFRRACFRS